MTTRLPVTEITLEEGWRERLEAFAGRRRESWILAALVAGAVVVGLVLWARGAPATIAPPARSREGQAFVAPSPEPVLLVHVAGEVRRPGLYELPAGARVADAIQAARGATRRADLDALNLAEQLQDGIRVEVLRRGAAPETLAVPEGSPTSEAPAPVNLNLADQAALETIPEIGPVTAAAILEYRAQVGSFTSVDELLEVSGVGPATLEAVRPYVTL